ncbi:glycosyltransferase family 2 protein [Salinimicrobium sp. HB62]|uniref:glycosyltransferase family 2 protein n=1 Tax=Salinimicrobium sp. HB62 TaxID=3077781 RepID=UPI002D7684B3|nr:glycosyltransferase family 2 protein [Salinimicrobium sp. HB62]
MKEPLVSIIIPTFNRSTFLRETINSVKEQSYHNWECLVVDDGSSDFTKELMEFILAEDSRIKYLKRPETWLKGANSCRNFGFKKSKGEYIQWLDSDDIISSEKLESQIKCMLQNDADLATCKWGRFYQLSDARISPDLKEYKDFDSSLLFFEALAQSKGFFPIHAYLFKRELIEKGGGWLSLLNINQDGEFMARMIINSSKICFSNKGVAYYRFSQQGVSAYDSCQKVENLINSWRIIEAYLKIKYNGTHFEFIETAKRNIYKANIGRKEVIEGNREFFKNIDKGGLKKVVKKFLLK